MHGEIPKKHSILAACSVALVLVFSAAIVPAGATHIPSLNTTLPYNFSIPGPSEVTLAPDGPKIPVLPAPECDEEGFNSVKFCYALGFDFNRVTIQIWDTGNPTPIPIGAQYTFRTSDGDVLWQDVMCGHKNTFVPEGADELLVELAHPNSFVHEDHQYGFCAAAPVDGEVWLKWMHGTPGGPPAPADPECPDCPPCHCTCECHPIFGCECECTHG